MGVRINTNIFSLTAQRHLSRVTERLRGNFSRLASGLRITSAADDPAGLGISERMRAKIRSYGAAARNTQDGISLVQTAEAALGETGDGLARMRELAIQASNGTLNTNDRATINSEFTAIIAEINRVADQTEFNGIKLLNGDTAAISVQVGTDMGQTVSITNNDSDATALGVNSLLTTTLTNAQNSLATIDDAIDLVAASRGSLGATTNILRSRYRSILSASENLAAAESRIRDVDIAKETAELTRNSILQQAAVAILSQANSQPQLALSLIG
ncbi:MAG: flagellin [Planctomycetota bacterium]|jgi:flagellin